MWKFIPFLLLFILHDSAESSPQSESPDQTVTEHSQGLHGYIGFSASVPDERETYNAGMGFYTAAWSLIREPVANFQIGLAGSWITPDNRDNPDQPLAPVGTLARDNWPRRGPTWSSVFQTIEGGLGYWARNHFRYGPPKFSMNSTPQCYDYEIGSPGWSFFYHDEALPDEQLGIAQLSNRLLIPPDALPFEGTPDGEFLGYTYMALPFTDAYEGDPPTGDLSWTCFISSENYNGPIAFFIPETWSKIGKLFNYPFIYKRGLDSRMGIMGGGAMEINTVPRFDVTAEDGTVYSKIPALHFPVNDEGEAVLVQDVTYYSKEALFNPFKEWRDGGDFCSGRFDERGAWRATLTTRTTSYRQAEEPILDVESVFNTKVYDNYVWGLEWFDNEITEDGRFPQYFKQVGDTRVPVAESEVPAVLVEKRFRHAEPGPPYTSPEQGAWTTPGPSMGPYTAELNDGSVVTYSWYRFIDQPSFQQYDWSEEKREALQSFVEQIHQHWDIDGEYMAPPTRGTLVTLDPGLLVEPPAGFELGYVPIVTHQEAQ